MLTQEPKYICDACMSREALIHLNDNDYCQECFDELMKNSSRRGDDLRDRYNLVCQYDYSK